MERQDRAEHQDTEQVTDSDIEEILEQGEAGIGDLMAAYEPIERRYFASQAATAARQPVTYCIDTSPR